MFFGQSQTVQAAKGDRYYRYCKMCKKHIGHKRADAITCGPTCRQGYKRMCDFITKEMAAGRQ